MIDTIVIIYLGVWSLGVTLMFAIGVWNDGVRATLFNEDTGKVLTVCAWWPIILPLIVLDWLRNG